MFLISVGLIGRKMNRKVISVFSIATVNLTALLVVVVVTVNLKQKSARLQS